MNSTTKPHPLNNNILIIYFIGGVTSYEMKLVKDAFIKETNYNVILSAFSGVFILFLIHILK